MEEVVFATFVSELKDAWGEAVPVPDLIELLYDIVAEPIGLQNKNKDTFTVTPGTASKIMNRAKGGNTLKAIRAAAGKKKVRDKVETLFQERVVKRLHPDKIPDLIMHITEGINSDSEIAADKKVELLKYGNKEHLAAFLGFTYLYTLSRDNVLKAVRKQMKEDLEEYKRHPLAVIPVPDEVIEEEKKYADAILAIYSQREHTDIDLSTINAYPNYVQHFYEQREYYFAAEAVRRGTRDIYKDEEQFEVLKKETYEGVKETWEDEDITNGMKRLREVLKQAVMTPIDRCWLSRDTDWIGNSQKKGVCHFLVKEDKLKGWVKDDDGQGI